MRFLDAATTRTALPMSDAIQAMEAAFGDNIEVPVRVGLGSSLFMPGRVADTTGIKVVSTVPGKPFGIVAVFGPDGACRGLVDGPTLTAIRTAAGAGLATRLLARPDARTMAMLGAGAMAFDQISAVQEVRPVGDVLIWSRTLSNAEALAETVGGTAVPQASDAVTVADVITTATPATASLFAHTEVQPGTHINAVGAFTPQMVEIPPETVRAALVFVDEVAAAQAEAGDLIQAGVEPSATITDLLVNRAIGRTSQSEITFFKSVGIASQDVAAATVALDNADAADLGFEFS